MDMLEIITKYKKLGLSDLEISTELNQHIKNLIITEIRVAAITIIVLQMVYFTGLLYFK